jgi:PQQ-dependent catabolism-associated CXXCW motif protein
MVLAGLACCLAAAAPEPAGFRMDHYRGEVPGTLAGARVIHTGELERLIAAVHPVLIDVLPAPAPPPDDRPGLPRMPLPHRDIAGSVWLADAGRGALAPAVEAGFRASLAALTRGHRSAPIVFYCLAQCWMSWNAAKRAVLLGYTDVLWYPDGIDGWQQAGLPTAINKPVDNKPAVNKSEQ